MKALRITFGCVALLGYLLLFAAGMLVSSQPYRQQLSDHSSSLAPIAQANAATDAASAKAKPLSASALLKAFLLATLLYTPTNVALLTILAGFVGGCASYLTYSQAAKQLGAMPDESSASPARRLFRTESPFASMFRSLLVYLATMAGIFVTTSAPFAAPTAEQYVRLAAMISVFAFIVGYDPTKFHELIDMLPKRKN